MNKVEKGFTFKHSILVYVCLFLGMAFFGSGTPAAKIVTARFPLFMAPFLRLLAAALLTTPLLIVHRKDLRGISKGNWLLILGIGAIGLVAFSIFLLTGMRMVNGVVGAMVMSISPAVVALGAAWFLGDHLGWRKITAVFFAISGVLIINVWGKSIQAAGWTLALGSLLVFGAVCSATAYSLFAKKASRDVKPVLLVPLAAWVATVFFAIPGIYQAAGFDFAKPSFNEWFALIWWGIGPFAVGTSLWFMGLESVKASIASGFMGAMPASGLVLSYVWLGDAFHWIHLLGFVFVLASIGIVVWTHWIKEREMQRKQKKHEGHILCPC